MRVCQYLPDCSVVTFCCADDMSKIQASTSTVHAVMACAGKIQTRLTSERGPTLSRGHIVKFYMQTFPPLLLRLVGGVDGLLRNGAGKLLLERMDCAEVSRLSIDGISRLRAALSGLLIPLWVRGFLFPKMSKQALGPTQPHV
jgi:hypothetical protein